MPDWAPHHSADKIVFEANKGYVKTAIVCPPTIYGQGRGPSNQRSHQIPDMAKCVLERKSGFQVGNGENRMANVGHFSDCFFPPIRIASRIIRIRSELTCGLLLEDHTQD